ncbi:MAG: 50S ribosomal protein L17 [Bacteroidetes bacterium]|nr:50S ribosomal protein L17 [Bacteroidota bacterium]
MIHNRRKSKLNRTASHRKSLLSSLSKELLRHKKITTTLAKAKVTRMVVEKIITRAKKAVLSETDGKKNVHSRRELFRALHDREVVKTLIEEIVPKVSTRNGGYTRIVKLGQRLGDGAHIALIQLVDFTTTAEEPTKSTKTDRKKRVHQKSQKKIEAETTTSATA